MKDFTYTTNGLYYSVHGTNDKAWAALEKWMSENNTDNQILSIHWKAFKAAIKRAGYTIGKSSGKITDADIELLRELLGDNAQ